MNEAHLLIANELLTVIRLFEQFDFSKKLSRINTEEFKKRATKYSDVYVRNAAGLAVEVQNAMEYDFGLITFIGENKFILTQRGQKAKQLNGYDKLLAFEEKEEKERHQKEDELRIMNQSVIDTNDTVKKSSIITLIIAGAAAIFTALPLFKKEEVKIYDWQKLVQAQERIEENLRQLKESSMPHDVINSSKKSP